MIENKQYHKMMFEVMRKDATFRQIKKNQTKQALLKKNLPKKTPPQNHTERKENKMLIFLS